MRPCLYFPSPFHATNACCRSVGRGRRFSLPNKREPEGAHRCHICTGIAGLTPPTPALRLGPPLPTSAPRLGSLLPHRHQEWAHPAHICAGTGLCAQRESCARGAPAHDAPRSRVRADATRLARRHAGARALTADRAMPPQRALRRTTRHVAAAASTPRRRRVRVRASARAASTRASLAVGTGGRLLRNSGRRAADDSFSMCGSV